MKGPEGKSAGGLALAAALAVLVLSPGGGCVAVPVGKPEVYTHTATVSETASVPERSEVVGARPECIQPRPGRLEVKLLAQVREVFPQTKHDERVAVKKQKRLAFGFFPAGAPYVFHPKGGLLPARQRNAIHEGDDPADTFPKDYAPGAMKRAYGQHGSSGYDEFRKAYNDGTNRVGYAKAPSSGEDYASGEAATLLKSVGFLGLAGMVNALLAEPFSGDGWSGIQEFVPVGNGRWAKGYRKDVYDVAGTPEVRALGLFPPGEREKMGLVTCFDVYLGEEPAQHDRRIAHSAVFGFWKYLDVSVEGPTRIGGAMHGTETKERWTPVEGPYEVELRIPDAGVSLRAQVGRGNDTAAFELPQAEPGGEHRALLRFRSVAPRVDALGRRSLERIAGQEVVQPVRLPEKPRPVGTPMPRPAGERKPERAPWDIETVEAFRGGRAEYRVTIRDAALKAFEVEREVRPEIERNLRAAFLAAMPGMEESRVRAYAVAEYEGRTIRFRGVAFSVQPLTDGWRYDADSRRGSVRLRLSEGMSPEEAKRWARENIETLVQEKNVALEAGTVPPAGAVYRSLDEVLEDGVLTVEFEVVE